MRWQYYIAYYIEGIMAIIKEWLNNDRQDSIDTIAAIIEECVIPLNGTKGKYIRLENIISETPCKIQGIQRVTKINPNFI